MPFEIRCLAEKSEQAEKRLRYMYLTMRMSHAWMMICDGWPCKKMCLPELASERLKAATLDWPLSRGKKYHRALELTTQGSRTAGIGLCVPKISPKGST